MYFCLFEKCVFIFLLWLWGNYCINIIIYNVDVNFDIDIIVIIINVIIIIIVVVIVVVYNLVIKDMLRYWSDWSI